MANYVRVHRVSTQSGGELEVRTSSSGSTVVGLWITSEKDGRYQGCVLSAEGLDELRRILEVGA